MALVANGIRWQLIDTFRGHSLLYTRNLMGRFGKLEVSGEQPEKQPSPRKSRPSQPLGWLEQAVEERRCGHYENSLRLYSRALEDDKSQVDGWLGQVQMLIQLDETVEAELWSRKALELFPGNGDLFAGRAQALGRLGEMAQAISLSDGSLKQPGESAYRWQVRGELIVWRQLFFPVCDN